MAVLRRLTGRGEGTHFLSPRHVPRPRLTGLLDEAAAQAIVIAAPAGYGKTTLAAEWLESKEHVAWYQASAAEADLVAFSTALAAAAAAVVPRAGARLRRRARVAERPEDAARPLAEILADDLAAWPDDAWLAIDDYHLAAESGAVDAFVDWLLTLAPVRLLVTTRRRPAWASARRILYGEVVELGSAELAMTDDEAASVVRSSSETVAALVARADGWPAVVGLAALSASVPMPRGRIADALYRYLAEEVYRAEPPEVRDFMLAASVPLTVDEHVAGEVLGVEDGEPAISVLREDGLLQPSAGGVLRFHPLLREFLLDKLAHEDPGRRARLAARAVADARARGRWEEAFELAIESGERGSAAEVLTDVAPALLEAGRLETVERALAQCGDFVLEHPRLVLARAEALLRRGELFEAAALASDLARRLPNGDPCISSAWYLAGRAAHLLSEDERALDGHLRAAETAAEPHELARALWGATVVAAQLESERLDGLVERLEALAPDDLDARLQLVSAKVFRGTRGGTLAGIWADAEALVHACAESGEPMAANRFLVAASYLATARADYGAAHELADRAVAACEEFRLGRMKTAFCLCHRVAAEIGLRRFTRAERTLERLTALGIDHTRVLVSERRNLRTKLLLARGELEQVLGDGDGAANGSPAAQAEHAGLVAIAAAALGDAARARAETRRAREAGRSIEADFYAEFASTLTRLDGPSSPARARRRALELVGRAAAAEFLDAFVIAYRASPELLAVVAGDPEYGALARTVLSAANDQVLARKVGVTGMGPLNGERAFELLTPRESQVLELMAEGLGNAEIARRLFISQKTAKVHVYHIFEKLNVETRVQAVLAARDLLTRD